MVKPALPPSSRGAGVTLLDGGGGAGEAPSVPRFPQKETAMLEYTDAPSATTPTEGTADPTELGRLETVEGKASDVVAVLLSVLPGLGHIYKGHRLVGLLLMFAGTPFAIGLALLIATGTAGFGIGLLPIYWVAVMVHVYAIQDRVVTPEVDEGEDF
jgi:hypothetical protein